ncbi:ribbon-helix-helix protein, CopG family [Cyanobacterium aponinum AL20118]|uniref:Ribbon-helix-helix protein, CopG family n=1 Tax=Cyanobacterium aponinum AL20115 TaxID=3090662 RepID=A0AAF1C6F5_9CHRO|nr:ribbon-helix-helix protein, CopG family [Cyanobacterium aponinum]PHV63125.1 toxin-antitoxin system HicB family antitoxin [Cyanobacterium aponinum IPPAS B-1201]WPF88869.1 ribbon-helix-helix protein, CopG family [Cyanobacterium aponinum AL20115]
MATLTIRLPDDKHERLKQLAQTRGVSVNKLMEEFSTKAIAEFDAYNRFQVMASKGDIPQGLALLDKLDASF